MVHIYSVRLGTRDSKLTELWLPQYRAPFDACPQTSLPEKLSRSYLEQTFMFSRLYDLVWKDSTSSFLTCPILRNFTILYHKINNCVSDNISSIGSRVLITNVDITSPFKIKALILSPIRHEKGLPIHQRKRSPGDQSLQIFQ